MFHIKIKQSIYKLFLLLLICITYLYVNNHYTLISDAQSPDIPTSVNCDNNWSLIDAVMIKRYDSLTITGTETCNQTQVYTLACDINGDAQCGLIDAVIVQQCNALIDNPYCVSLTQPIVPTETPVTPTATPVTPTATPITPTATPITPTATPITPTATPAKSAYQYHAIPGVIEAEHFDYGGQGISYNDTTAGAVVNTGFRSDTDVDFHDLENGDYKVGWLVDGEWLEYTADLEEGEYRVDFEASSNATAPGQINLNIGGTDFGSVNIERTGNWSTIETFSLNNVIVPNNANDQVIRLTMIDGGYDLDRITFVKIEPTPTPTAVPVPTTCTTSGINKSDIVATASTYRFLTSAVPANVLDGDLSTYWQTKDYADTTTYLTLALNDTQFLINGVSLAFLTGYNRSFAFDVQISKNGVDWKTVYTGNSIQTTQLETYTFDAEYGSYVQINGYGNTMTNWTSITEAELCLTPVSENNNPQNSNNFSSPSGSWTYCGSQDERCEFNGVREVAYGRNSNWNYAIEVDSVYCNEALDVSGSMNENSSNSCWIRTPSESYTAVRSIPELRIALANSNQNIRMKRGTYVATSLSPEDTYSIMIAPGSNNVVDFSGVTLDYPTALLRTMSGPTHSYAEWRIEGDNITFINGNFINTYPEGHEFVSDFKAHNENRDYQPGGSSTAFRIWGNDFTMQGTNITVRGSFPYGYGDMFGKGTGSTYGLRKHSAIQVVGDNTVIKDVYLRHLAFGHGIFMQGSDNTLIQDTIVHGRMRLGDEMYNDGEGSLPQQQDFLQQSPDWYIGMPIFKDFMYNLTEDGIRSYASGTHLDGTVGDTGDVRILNTDVVNMRSCIALAAAKEAAYLENVEVRGCSNGYSLPNSGGEVVNSRGDAAFGPLILMPYSNQKNQTYDLTIIEPERYVGDHDLTWIGGSNHDITLKSDGNTPSELHTIRIGYNWDRWALIGQPENNVANGVYIDNQTNHPIVLTDRSNNTTGSSVGPVTDNGSGNSVD